MLESIEKKITANFQINRTLKLKSTLKAQIKIWKMLKWMKIDI